MDSTPTVLTAELLSELLFILPDIVFKDFTFSIFLALVKQL